MLTSFKSPTCCRLLIITVTILQGAIAAGDEPMPVKNAYTSEKDIRQGRLFVNGYCSRCHGKDATGEKGPNLTIGRFRHGSTDEALFKNIQNGIRGTGMPALPLRDIPTWQVIAFLRAKQNETAAPPPDGDAAKGRELFVHHKCNACHWAQGSGGRLGPDLGQWRGSAEFFRRA